MEFNMSKFHRALTPEPPEPEQGFTRNFQNRLILPLGSQEITFTVPPTASPMSPRRGIADILPPVLSPMSSRKSIGDLLSPMISRRRGSEDPSCLLPSSNDFVGDLRGSSCSSPVFGKSSAVVADAVGFTGPAACSLGALNPALYKTDDLEDDFDSYPEDHMGRVWFQVEYKVEAEKLLVTLIKAKNLPSRSSGSVTSCDPIVRLHLMPDERRCFQTKIRRKTCNPRFEETFGFQITEKELQDRALKLTFLDVVREKKHQIIGHALYALKEFKWVDGKKILKMDLTKDAAVSPLEVGELQVSLSYNDSLERLTVTVGDTRNLKVPEIIRQYPNEFQARVCLLQQDKCVKAKKTEVVKTESSPAFNESFIFKVSLDQLDITAISISLNASKKSDSTLGRVLLGSFMFARGRANRHWSEMMSRKKEHVQMWHSVS